MWRDMKRLANQGWRRVLEANEMDDQSMAICG
jgi:hypothetical protein